MRLPFSPRLQLQSPAALSGLSSLLLLASVGLAVWFGLQISKPSPVVAPVMPNAPSAQFRMDQSAEARLLGVETQGGLTPPSVQLLGVFASLQSQGQGGGAAVLAVDGKPEESVQVGDPVANGWVLAEVGPTYVLISRTGQRHRIDLPVQQDTGGLQRIPAR